MPTRDEILRVLADLARRVENQEIDIDYSLEAFDYLYERRSARTLIEIESKLDRLLARYELGHCRLAGARRSDVIEFMTGIGVKARTDALSHLNGCLDGAQHLIICDPFFLKSTQTVSPSDYVAGVESVLPKALKILEVFSGKRKRDGSVAEGLNQMFRRKGVRINHYKTDHIHDRVWIKNHTDAYSVGTSFNGLGKKCAFILPLPSDDLRAFLTEISALRNQLPMSRSV
ncbi:MAG TPA: hypothetical protein VGH40_24730 [Roseiarcus sp.]|jgi:hypothetical protein